MYERVVLSVNKKGTITVGVPRRGLGFQSRLLCTLLFQGVEESYDAAVTEYFQPYHHFVDKLLRFGFNLDRIADHVITCSKYL